MRAVSSDEGEERKERWSEPSDAAREESEEGVRGRSEWVRGGSEAEKGEREWVKYVNPQYKVMMSTCETELVDSSVYAEEVTWCWW